MKMCVRHYYELELMWNMWSSVNLLFLFVSVRSWPYYAPLLPNADSVPNPCNPSKIWIGLGHMGDLGSGPRNAFGLDFARLNFEWSKELCMADSDGDGRSNGLELGDPDCLWTPTNGHELLPAFSNPGVCDPWDSPHCRNMNGSITCDKTEMCETTHEPGMKQIDLQLNNVLIPDAEWTFACQIFDLPTDSDYHMVAGQPIIDKSATILGGIGVFGCDPNHPRLSFSGRPFHCSANPKPPCQDLISLLSAEQNGTCLPRNVGITVGRSGYKQVLLRWIFINPRKQSGIKSNTGMTLFYTPILREFSAGIATIEETHFTIPPKLTSYSVSSACPSDCTQKQITAPITVISGINIMNELGRKQSIQVYRKDKVINSITNDEAYNMFYPKIYWYDTPVPILPGDMLKMQCQYNSLLVNETVPWGLDGGELCKGAILYYPKENWLSGKCKSFRTVPLCLFETGGIAYGCSLREFQAALYTLPVYMELIDQCSNSTCSDACFERTSLARRTSCLNGDLYHMWKVAGKTGSMALLYKALEACEKRFDSTGGLWGTGVA